MKRKSFLVAVLLAVLIPTIPYATAKACGHEGWYAGAGYTQLLQFSPDHQLVAAGAASQKINWKTRWGMYGKVGYDFCGSRWGVEVPVSFDRQRLDRAERIGIIGIDANALYHIVETSGGIDFYWIAGTGLNYAMEGPIKNRSRAGGVNVNFGPGLNYFIKKTKPNVVALNVFVPVKYTLYLGNNLSGNKRTSVLGIPFRIGFSVGF